tara:strand:+ start:510 stop:1139 length:630 start_codon:yes stop_codon:yes gene_type:complete
MILTNYYWYFKSVVPEHICDDIVRYGKSIQDEMAVTSDIGNNDPKKLNTRQTKNLKKRRDSDVVWMSDRWIYKEIQPYIHLANANAGWNFEWDYSEPCQFTRYKKGQFYDWHCDSLDHPFNAPNTPSHGKIRKLSVTVTLTDPKDYKGGELEFDFRNKNKNKPETYKCKEILPKGSLVVFPSFVWHRVCPIKSGERNSLVIWNIGKPFR